MTYAARSFGFECERLFGVELVKVLVCFEEISEFCWHFSKNEDKKERSKEKSTNE
jgi:hypothetical protein|tara:strand:- start:251 stop:415 length:165 start_codon:yes stop_codon:yes gene_type:complete